MTLISKGIGVALIAVWIVVCTAILWSDKKPFLVNAVMILLTFLVIGAAYILPFWLLFVK